MNFTIYLLGGKTARPTSGYVPMPQLDREGFGHQDADAGSQQTTDNSRKYK